MSRAKREEEGKPDQVQNVPPVGKEWPKPVAVHVERQLQRKEGGEEDVQVPQDLAGVRPRHRRRSTRGSAGLRESRGGSSAGAAAAGTAARGPVVADGSPRLPRREPLPWRPVAP